MGVPGYGLDQILLSFLAQGVTYRPDLVLVFLNTPVTDRHRTGIVQGSTVYIPDRLDAVEFDGESGGTASSAGRSPLRQRPLLVRAPFPRPRLPDVAPQVPRLGTQLAAEDERFWQKTRKINAKTLARRGHPGTTTNSAPSPCSASSRRRRGRRCAPPGRQHRSARCRAPIWRASPSSTCSTSRPS